MDIIDNNFCNDTPIRENVCSLCGKKLAYIDSPFGAIPSLELMEKFYEDFKLKFEKQRRDLEKFSKSEVVEASKEKQALIEDFLEKIKNNYNILTEKIETKLTKFDLLVDKKIELLQEREDSVNYFVNHIYTAFSDVLCFFSELIEKIVSLTHDFTTSKNNFSETITPKLNLFIDSLEIFQKIIPNEEIYSVGMQQLKSNDLFSLNQNLASKEELETKRIIFYENWEKLSP